VDVGTNQLAWKLRQDPRVVPMEQTNIRYLDSLPEPADLATCDVSYIGLEIVTPAALRLTTQDAFYVFLIKPQFEAGREQVGKGGVVRDPQVHRDVIMRLGRFWESLGLQVSGLARSPITGPAGNFEYLAYLRRSGAPTLDLGEEVERVVGDLHG
jgi:23S rRNA (cytidine1920-2'-O)/16S rRNA (cytidine1409-2'-O)-methyltransferase